MRQSLFISYILLFLFFQGKTQTVDSLEIRNAQFIQFDSLQLVSKYTQIPSERMNRAKFRFICTIQNNSGDTVKGFVSKLSITQLEDVDGNTINGFSYEDIDSSLSYNLLKDSSQLVVFDSVSLSPIYCGKYELRYSVLSTDSGYADTVSHIFLVSDSVMAIDYDQFNSSVSPFDFQDTGTATKPPNYQGVNVMGALFYHSSFYEHVYSIGLKVSSDSNNIGVSIATVMYRVDPSKLDSNNVADYDPYYFSNIYTIKASDTGKWIALTIDTTGLPLAPSGYYIVGWEEVISPAGKRFSVQNDTSAIEGSRNISFVQFYDPYVTQSGTGWISVAVKPAIRLHSGPPRFFWPTVFCAQQPVGVAEFKKEENTFKEVAVYPNPASENLYIQLSQEEIVRELNLYDLLGKEKVVPIIQLDGWKYNLNLENLPKGVYLLKLQFETGAMVTKKIIRN